MQDQGKRRLDNLEENLRKRESDGEDYWQGIDKSGRRLS